MVTFRDLGVLPEICDALERKGITTPFAIQEMTLSVALLGTDLSGAILRRLLHHHEETNLHLPKENCHV